MQLTMPTATAAVRAPGAQRPASGNVSGVGARPVAPDQPRAPKDVREYYAPAQGKAGVALLRSLHEVSEAFHRERSYENARSMMFKVIEDLDDDDVVTDLYSGAKVAGVTGLRTATAKGLTTEHVWPQSEGATEEARSDLHHLRPAFQSLNTHRSNLPYGMVTNADWASEPVKGVDEISLVGTDAAGVKVFTPRASMRGDLARDQFYFFTRYHGDRPKAFSLDNFRVSLPILLEWHAEDPVDDGERARNEAIFRLQGNRNPYVDHPGFVEKVGFSEALLRRRSRAATS